MKKLYDYIEALKGHTRLDTNTKIAEYLEVSRQYITTLKYGRNWLSRDKCLDIAKALGIDVTEIILVINSEKSESQEDRERFQQLAEKHRTPINPPKDFLPDGAPKRRLPKK